jgi:hypothetical protein
VSYYDEGLPPIMGNAQASGEADKDDTEYPVAVLWMPDPESRSGWCERWVMPKKVHKQNKTGFRSKHNG